MRTELKYIELKTGYGNENGPAWIGRALPSKSGRAFYFNGKAFRRIRFLNVSNYVSDDDEDYWISGVKKSGSNRSVHGSGKIMLQKLAVEEFLVHTGQEKVDTRLYDIVDIPDDFSAKEKQLAAR
ncbi:MAG: hypothetical protein Q4G02_04200 [bacterium]|nr:hypothetical protein [bacterium]